MKKLTIALSLLLLALAPAVHASTAYGTLNNFDCVNDTGVEAHGFEIELDDIHSTDVTYTYDYNHYGIPKITQDNTDPAHPKVFIRYAATWTGSAWSAYTAIPSGPITPTDGHQFTNPSINFGGEHFGAGYYGNPTAVKYNWLIDDGTHNLVHGPPVYVATPTFIYNPPVPAQPVPQVQAVIVPPPPPVLPPKQFGEATWVKEIKTTTHNANKVELVDLRDPDPGNPAVQDWTNGEPAEVEMEWRILQTEFADAANPKGVLAGAPEDLPGGDEVITRRYEFYKYTGPVDAETGEAMGDAVGPDGIHGTGSVTYADHFDFGTGEWVKITVDLSTVEVVGDFFGAQMSGFDVAPALGLIDHIPDGDLGVAYADRTVVVPGANTPFHATVTGSLPDGTNLDEFSGVFSGTPAVAGVFTFTVDAKDLFTDAVLVSKQYTVTIPPNAVIATSTITTSAAPIVGGSTVGDGVYDDGTPVTVTAAANPGYAFINWTEGGVEVSASAVYLFTAGGNRTLVANFVPTYTVTTSASPASQGTTSGDGVYNSGANVTVDAVANAGYKFLNWTEGGGVVSASQSYSFTAGANRALVANFTHREDVNGDGAVTAGDLQLTINAALGIDIGGQNADVNGDGIADAIDVQMIIIYVLGL
ncbi:MAG: putative Ig domain-containing protein [Candidatus Hydrogenedentes bacterium]|nr:putative Ig domain-containing protein [Candidatus Hydrogenedentota bacterium]